MRALTLVGDWDPRPNVELDAYELAHNMARDARQVWRNPRWAMADVADAQIRSPHDVLIKILRVGISRSNCKMSEPDQDGYVSLPYAMRLPIIPGHEIAGEVVEIGSAVRNFSVGELVTAEALRPCGDCRACHMDKPNHCFRSGFAGLTEDGGMAEYLAVPERHIISINPVAERFGRDYALDVGSVCEPAAVAYVGMFARAGGVTAGDTVAVFGCGPIGLSAMALARSSGARKIIAFDRQPHRISRALEFGADVALNVDELAEANSSPEEAMREFTEDSGINFAIEATGSLQPFFDAIGHVLAIESKVLSLGVDRKAIPINLFPYQQTGSIVTGMLGHLGGFDPIIALHAQGKLNLCPMVESRFRMDDALLAVNKASQFVDTKVVIHPQE